MIKTPIPIFNILAVILSLLFVSYATAGSIDNFKGLQGSISISGGTAHSPVMNELKSRIEQVNHNVLILVRAGGSSLGIEQVGKGLVDIGNAGRPLKTKEQKQYNLESIPFAIDALAVVVHPTNPLSGLDSDTIRSIFFGTIKNWQEVGGRDNPISVYSRYPGSGTKAIFVKECLKKEPTDTVNLIENHDQMRVAVSWDKNAIGYMSMGHVEKSKVKPLLIDGVEPSLANIKSGKYNLSRKLYMNISADKAKVSGLTRKFVDYVLSSEVRPVIKQAGFIPLK